MRDLDIPPISGEGHHTFIMTLPLRGEISKVLGSSAIPLEEAKADVMGVWNMLYKVLV